MRPLCLHKAVKTQTLNLLDSPGLAPAALHALHVHTSTSFCMTTCIHILFILLCLNNLPLNLTCNPVSSKPECIIKHFWRLKSICQTFDHLNKLNKSCLNHSMSYSVPIRTVRYTCHRQITAHVMTASAVDILMNIVR